MSSELRFESYVLALLEDIAYNTSGTNLERVDYFERLRNNASNIQSTTEIFRDVRAQPEARPGPMPEHDQGKDARVRSDQNDKFANLLKGYIKGTK